MAVTATGFITDAELTTSVQAALHKTSSTLNANVYGAEVTAANSDAYKRILGHFGRKGYSVAQIQTWVEGTMWQRRLGRLFLLVELNGGQPEEMAWERLLNKELDRLDKIDTLVGDAGLLDPTGTVAIFEIHQQGLT